MARIPVALAPVVPVERPDLEFTASSARELGSGLTVALVGFQDQDNLGLRYLKSAAEHHGHRCNIVTYDANEETVSQQILQLQCDVVGLSLIFQYMAPQFSKLVAALRRGGFEGHITIGGHYPSFDPENVLQRIPGLDSVVRFEGEATFVELLAHLEHGQDWKPIVGLALVDQSGEVRMNPLRPSIEDLDILPFPDRAEVSYEGQDLPTASILASRGCPWNCSFCSIRPFYEAPGGALRRLRRPEQVVREMVELHRTRGVVAFLFQDDDFMATGPRGRAWALELADALGASEIAGRVSLKISCRSDEVDLEVFRRLRDMGGLTHVYLGVESGDPETLKHLRKQLKPDAHLRAADVFRTLDLSFDFGYMVLEPYSTFAAVRSGVDFLDRFVGDGWSVATFCRTLPYAGTPLEVQLRSEGRLLGTPFEPDYEFLDPRLDVFYDWLLYTFRRRNFSDEGLCHVLRALQFELHLRVNGRRPATAVERATARHLTRMTNRIATSTLRGALEHCESTTIEALRDDPSYLLALAEFEQSEEARIEVEVMSFYESFRSSIGQGFDQHHGVDRHHGVGQHPRIDLPGTSGMDSLPGGFSRTWTVA